MTNEQLPNRIQNLCATDHITYEIRLSHLEEVKERNMFDQRPIEALVVFEEEEVGEGGIYHVGVSPRKLDQLQPFLTTVPASPEGCGVLLWPPWPSVGLH